MKRDDVNVEKRAALLSPLFCLRGAHMAITLKSLGIDQLGTEERLALIEALWDSLPADESALPITEAQLAELERRLADYEQNPDEVVPWDEVRASLKQRIGR